MTQGRTSDHATEKGTAKQQFAYKTVRLPRRDWDLDALLLYCRFAGSLTEARRLLQQGAVSYNDQKVGDYETVRVNEGSILRVGKKRIAVLVVGEKE